MSKKILKTIKQYGLILFIGLMNINASSASPNETEPSQSNKQLSKQLNDIRDELAQIHSPNSPLLPSNHVQAQETHTSVRGFLNKHRLMWYAGFAGTGAGLALSNAFDVTEIAAYTPWMLGGLVAGVSAGFVSSFAINKSCAGGDECLNNKWVNIGAALVSFVPWIVFGTTKPASHP